MPEHDERYALAKRRLWIALLAAVPLVPQAPVPKYEVKRATAPVTVDGKLDEAAWAGASAPVALQFLWDHQTGAKQKTSVRVVWDAQALYLGYEADDADITARFLQRDDPTYQDDAVEFFVNPNPKQEVVYYGFEMNVRGVLYDYLNYNSRTLFKRWDATGMKIATTMRGTLNERTDTDTGWTLEASIPWANFEELSRRPPVPGTVWNALGEEHTMNRILRVFPATALATLVAASVQAQITNNPPGGSGPGRGRGVEASVVTNVRSPEVNADHTITFRLPAPNARKVRVYTDMPKLGDTPVNGSAGFDMTQDADGVWSFTTPKLAPSYYQYWFEVDGLTMPDPQNTFVRPASGVYKSVVALPGKEADFMMFRDVPHGNLIEHHYLNRLTKIARRVVVYTPPDYHTSNKKYPVVYLLHGANDYERGWTQTGMANLIMDNLIAEKKAVPAIIVMPFGHEKTGSAGRQPEILALQQTLRYTPPPPAARGAGPGGPGSGRGVSPSGWSMEKEMLDYVIPYVEKEFRVIKNKDHRAIMGYSMGGGHATSIGFGHPELFATVGAFSGFGSTSLLIADPAKTNKNYRLIFIGSGTEDRAVNGGRTMHAALTKAGVKHVWSEDAGYGHDYQIWRQYFFRLMQQTFRD